MTYTGIYPFHEKPVSLTLPQAQVSLVTMHSDLLLGTYACVLSPTGFVGEDRCLGISPESLMKRM